MDSNYNEWVRETFGDIGELTPIFVKKSSIVYPNQITFPQNGLTQSWVEELIDKLWKDRDNLGAAACSIDFSFNPVCQSAAASGKRIKLDELISAGCVIIG